MGQLLRAFRHRNYQLFFGGQLISLTGTWMQQVAQSWLVYRLTRSSALLVPVGASMITQMAASNTLIQAMVPNRLRGRVMAVYTMMFTGMAPFGALLAGWIAGPVGAPGAVTAGALVCIAAAITFRLRLPSLRGEARELIIAQELAGGEPVQELGFTQPAGRR